MPSPVHWTQELIDRMLAMRAEGKSAAQIGAALGCSRSAIIGKIHRIQQKHGLRKPDRTRAERRAAPSARFTGRPQLPVVGQAITVAACDLHSREAPITPILTLVEAGVPCGILDVTGCRWPVGEDASVRGRHLFCNRERDGEGSYCAMHHPRPGTLSGEFSGAELNLIRAHWNGGEGLEWLAIKMKRAKSAVAKKAINMGLGRAA